MSKRLKYIVFVSLTVLVLLAGAIIFTNPDYFSGRIIAAGPSASSPKSTANEKTSGSTGSSVNLSDTASSGSSSSVDKSTSNQSAGTQEKLTAVNHAGTGSAQTGGKGITNGSTPGKAVQATPEPVKAAAPGNYTVKQGDTLASIANRFGITVSELKWENNIKSDGVEPGRQLTVTPRQTESLSSILKAKGISPSDVNLKIIVDKSDHVLGLFSNGVLLKSYHVELSENGLGDKSVEGDHKTPEGTFYICEKSVLNPSDYYLGTRWMRLSYPNIEDADRGLSQGIIDKATHDAIVDAIQKGLMPPQNTALGGGVGIHGGSRPELGSNWTWGCVGLTNSDVEDFFDYVKVGTQVQIQL